MKKNVLAWEIAGIFFITLAGSSLHFLFEWSGRFLPVALIAAVNESVWEHLKLAFWPSLIFAAIEYPFVRKHTDNFLAAKVSGISVMPLVIVAVFYSYTAIIGRSILAVDISSFVLAVVLGQLTGYAVMRRRRVSNRTKNVSITVLVVLTLAFSFLTYFPPRLPLFRDSRNGEYGITESRRTN